MAQSLFGVLRRIQPLYVRVPGQLVTTTPQVRNEIIRPEDNTRTVRSNEDRGGFNSQFLLGTSGKISAYLKIHDVKTDTVDKKGNKGEYSFSNPSLVRGIDFKLINFVLEMKLKREDYEELVKTGVVEPGQRLTNLVKVDLSKSKVPLFKPQSPDQLYVSRKRRLLELQSELSAGRAVIKMAKEELKEKFGDSATVLVSRLGREIANLLFSTTVKHVAGRRFEFKTPQERETVCVEIPFTNFNFTLDVDGSKAVVDTSGLRLEDPETGEVTWAIPLLAQFINQLEKLEERRDLMAQEVAEAEYGILFQLQQENKLVVNNPLSWKIAMGETEVMVTLKFKVDVDRYYVDEKTAKEFCEQNPEARWRPKKKSSSGVSTPV